MTEPEAAKALCRADTLLNMKHGLVRLDAVWGVGGGIRPVKYLVKQIMLLLKVLEALLLQMIACRFDACPRVENPNSGRISAFRNAYSELRSASYLSKCYWIAVGEKFLFDTLSVQTRIS